MYSPTKKLIADTMAEMIKSQPFDSITITDLVDRCNVSRQTFYYHFSDLLDVLELLINRKVESVIEECNKTTNLKDSIKIMLEAGLKNQKIIHLILDSRLRGRIEHRLLEAIKKGLLMGVDNYMPKKPLEDEQISLLVEFFSYGIIGVLLYKDMNAFDDLDRAAAGIYTLIRNTISPT